MNANKSTLDNSPLTADQAQQLARMLDTLSPTQAAWVSGYLAALGQGQSAPAEASAAPALTVLYGSETGNSEGVANQLAEQARARGFTVRVQDMADYKPQQLRQEQRLLAVVSTHGEGDPPEPAQDFYEFLLSKKASKLEKLQFAVLALGDLSYEHYCQAGRDLDARLTALGGQRIHDCGECDVDYEEAAGNWIGGVLGVLDAQPQVTSAVQATALSSADRYTRKNPFLAPVLDNILLSGRGSNKEVRHIELSVADSGLTWQPGDSLGVYPTNAPEIVEELLQTLGFDGDSEVSETENNTLRAALTRDYEITTLTRPLLEQYARLAQSAELDALLRDDQRPELSRYLAGRGLIDLVQAYPLNGIEPVKLLACLRRLPPRLYSIASSQRTDPDSVHLTVATVRYESHGRQRNGVASSLFADRLGEDDQIPVYIDHNKNFKLPPDPGTPIIMIGPGTGVAPFRAFMQEREELGTSGANWLLFGDQRFDSDFLYQSEWLRWRRSGLLKRIDVAFSRDQGHKIYVQDRLREQAATVFSWLEDGAYVYVCGDAERMAPDVQQAFIDIISEQGGLELSQASDYLKQMQKHRRYQRDVY